MVQEFTDQNFEEQVLKANKPVLVDFWAVWCGPCQMMTPVIEELSDEMDGKAIVGKLNVDSNPITSQKYEIMSIPSLLIFLKGKVVEQIVGLQPKEVIKEKLDKVITS